MGKCAFQPIRASIVVSSRGSILVSVLFVMIVLGLLAVSFAYRTGIESRMTRNQLVMVQLKTHAASAVAIAIGRLRENTNDFDHFAEPWHSHMPLSNEDWIPEWTQDSYRQEPEFVTDYQVIDEQGKLNLLYASSEALEKLGMTPEQIASLFDWMDEDQITQAEGAEQGYYLARQDPYRCKNAPLEHLDELLLIRGFNSFSYLGEDANHDRLLDPSENDGGATFPLDDGDGRLQLGWIDTLTCVGDGRINLNTAPKSVLAVLPISPAAVDQILGFRAFDENSSGELSDHVFRSAQDIEQLQGLTEADIDVLKAVATFQSSHFRIFAQSVHLLTGLRYHIEVLIQTTSEGPKILQWKGGYNNA